VIAKLSQSSSLVLMFKVTNSYVCYSRNRETARIFRMRRVWMLSLNVINWQDCAISCAISCHTTWCCQINVKRKPWWGVPEERNRETARNCRMMVHLFECWRWETFRNWRNRETARIFRVNLMCLSDSSDVRMFQGVEIAKCAKMSRHSILTVRIR